MNHPSRTFWITCSGVGLGLAFLFWILPPFHVLGLKANQRQSVQTTFNATAFVEKFWNESLVKSAEHATNAATLVAEIHNDIALAHKKYGHAAGLGSAYYYFLVGQGQVVAMDKEGISLTLTGGGASEVVLVTGSIFGNAVRDGTGLLDASAFANSQDFNALSAEINRRIEEQVLPVLRTKAVIGSTISFAGCAEIADDATDVHPMRVIPFLAAVR